MAKDWRVYRKNESTIRGNNAADICLCFVGHIIRHND